MEGDGRQVQGGLALTVSGGVEGVGENVRSVRAQHQPEIGCAVHAPFHLPTMRSVSAAGPDDTGAVLPAVALLAAGTGEGTPLGWVCCGRPVEKATVMMVPANAKPLEIQVVTMALSRFVAVTTPP